MTEIEYIYRMKFRCFVDFAFRELHPGEPFLDNWHVQLMADLLEFAWRSLDPATCRRMIFNLPPDSLKTVVCSIAFPAWVLGRDPQKSVLIVSETPQHALEIQDRCADLMSSKRYQSIFPRAKIRKASRQLELNYGGGISHAGIGHTLPHRRYDVVIFDNPQSLHNLERFNSQPYLEIARTLKHPKEGVIIVATRRLAENDLTSVLSRQGWPVYPIPAISLQNQELAFPPDFSHVNKRGELLHPALEDWDELQQHLFELGGEAFSYQYLQGLYAPQKTGQRVVKDHHGNSLTLIGSFDPTEVTFEDLRKLRAQYLETFSV
jgi:hypothetical protein